MNRWREDPCEGSKPREQPAEIMPINPMRLDQHCSDPPIEHESPLIGSAEPTRWNGTPKKPAWNRMPERFEDQRFDD